MSSNGKASITTPAAATTSKVAVAPQRPSNFFSPPPRRQREVSVPEWKLNCLTAEYGLPPTMRGTLQTGGQF